MAYSRRVLRVRWLVVGGVCLVLGGCGGASSVRSPSVVREPTAAERAALLADVKSVWQYESRAISPGVKALDEQPDVVSVRVSRTDPAFASAAVELRQPSGLRRAGAEIIAFERLDGSWQQDGEANLVAGPALSFTNACSGATPAGLRDLLCPNPWSILDYQRPLSLGYQDYSFPVAGDDLRDVDWGDIALPGAVCGTPRQLIQLHKGSTTLLGPADGWWAGVGVDLLGESYGELAPGLSAASVAVDCNNGGGTADGQLAFADVVFSLDNTSLHVLGVLTPQQPLIVPASHVPLIGTGRISRGEIVVPEDWYGQYDSTCCSTGRAKTIWVYARGKLSPKQTIVLHEPATKPPNR